MSLRDFFSKLGQAPTPLRAGPAWDALRQVVDPELGLDLVSLGMIRSVEVDGATVHVRMTLSTEGCPVGPELVTQVHDVLREAGFEPEVTLEFDPPWTPDDLEPAARARFQGR